MGTDPKETPIDLTGSVALVTGGSRGLGRAFALALAAAGAKVAVTARTAAQLAETVQLIERAGGSAIAIPSDVSAPDQVAHLVTTAEQLGPVNILVNNAGVAGPIGADWEVDPEGWWHTFEINMRGPFLCARAVLPGMVTRQRGRIVNISSGAAYNRLPLEGTRRPRPRAVQSGARHADCPCRSDAAIPGFWQSRCVVRSPHACSGQ